MEKWEYYDELLKDTDIPSRLNERGEAGWELVSLTPYTMQRNLSGWNITTSEYLAIYKRRKP